MTMDVTLVAGPPEIHGGGGTNFKWIVPINLRGLVRSTPTPKGADKTAPFLILVGFSAGQSRRGTVGLPFTSGTGGAPGVRIDRRISRRLSADSKSFSSRS